jgi:hypothetical protein
MILATVYVVIRRLWAENTVTYDELQLQGHDVITSRVLASASAHALEADVPLVYRFGSLLFGWLRLLA